MINRSRLKGDPALLFMAGIEYGHRQQYMNRAYGAGQKLREIMVAEARRCNHEFLAYLKASREAIK